VKFNKSKVCCVLLLMIGIGLGFTLKDHLGTKEVNAQCIPLLTCTGDRQEVEGGRRAGERWGITMGRASIKCSGQGYSFARIMSMSSDEKTLTYQCCKVGN